MNQSPPRRAERLVKWSLAPWERTAVLGDLKEEFTDLVLRLEERRARRWYWRQVLFSVWPNLLRRFRGDEHRLRVARMGVGYVAIGSLYGLLRPSTNRGFPLLGLIWLLIGLLSLFDSLFRKRLRRPRRPATKREAVLGFAGLVALVAAVMYAARTLHLTEPQLGILLLATILTLWLLPRSKTPSFGEFAVRHKVTPELEREALLAVNVPNKPLGLSGLVLCRARAADSMAENSTPLHVYDPIIDRTFTQAQSIRVCTVANLPDAHAKPHATIAVIGSDGRTVKSVRASLAVGGLEQISESWGDFADDDSAEHFGQIDVTLPLANVPPGSYVLRVTTADGAQASQREEPIVVIG